VGGGSQAGFFNRAEAAVGCEPGAEGFGLHAPEKMAEVFIDAYLPLCLIMDAFLCTYRQPTSDEAKRNVALLGFRSASTFFKAMAETLGTCARQLLRHNPCNSLSE
jgi:hypothetical protein